MVSIFTTDIIVFHRIVPTIHVIVKVDRACGFGCGILVQSNGVFY